LAFNISVGQEKKSRDKKRGGGVIGLYLVFPDLEGKFVLEEKKNILVAPGVAELAERLQGEGGERGVLRMAEWGVSKKEKNAPRASKRRASPRLLKGVVLRGEERNGRGNGSVLKRIYWETEKVRGGCWK